MNITIDEYMKDIFLTFKVKKSALVINYSYLEAVAQTSDLYVF